LALQQRQATPAAVPEGLLPESALAALHGLQVGPPPATPRALPARFPAATHLV